MKKFFLISNWILGLFFFFSWFFSLYSDTIAGIVFILVSLFFIPLTVLYIEKNIGRKINYWHKILIFVVGLFLVWLTTKNWEFSVDKVSEQNLNQKNIENKVNNIQDVEELTESKNDEIVTITEILDYEIVNEEDLSFKALGDKPLSSFTAKQIEKLSNNKKISYDVLISWIFNNKELENTIQFIIDEITKKDPDIDEISLILYSDKDIIDQWGWDLWYAQWSTWWTFWWIDSNIAKNNIRDSYEIGFHLKENIYEYLTQKSISEDKYWFSEDKRKQIYKEIVDAEKRAREDADKKFPTYENYEVKNIEENRDLNIKLMSEYKQQVRDKYGISEDTETKIAVEGIQKNWSY